MVWFPKLRGKTLRAPLIVALMLAASLLSAASTRVPIQDFLVRANYKWKGAHEMRRALNYRLSKYTQIRPTSFMRKGVMLHEAVHKPLRCVEKHIRLNCNDDYVPKTLIGWRPYNTFTEASDWKYQEYSNHIFGLAIDLDPELNPCCGCVKHWAKAKGCKESEGAKMMGGKLPPIGKYVIPQCWIDAFKRYGFYWLGDDPGLRDTMHFEYLAAPDAVSCED